MNYKFTKDEIIQQVIAKIANLEKEKPTFDTEAKAQTEIAISNLYIALVKLYTT